MNVINLIIKQHPDILKSVCDFFMARAIDPTRYQDIIDFLSNLDFLKKTPNHQLKLQLGYFTLQDYMIYAVEKKIVESVPTVVVELILTSMLEKVIILKPFFHGNEVLYTPNDEYIRKLKQYDLLYNVLFGFEYIAEKYLPCVFKIIVFKDGEQKIGTGFLTTRSDSQQIIITNKHVIDGVDKIEIEGHSDTIHEYTDCIADEENDLAFLCLKESISCQGFVFNEEIRLLAEILTIGYPPIPLTRAAYPVCHLGEISSNVENYWEKVFPVFHLGEINSSVENYQYKALFLFSAKTNPGNSGGPIIDSMGMVVGIITEQLDEQEGYLCGKLPYYAGIPSSEIMKFLEKHGR